MERRIIHLNIADFSVAVERLLDRNLKTRALIIAEPTARSVVHDMSDEAYGEGVRKGMDLAVARRRCRSALVLPPRAEQYRRVMDRCLQQILPYTPLVECASGSGHFYLDVSGVQRLIGPPQDIGRQLRNGMLRSLDLDPIWSVAPNKLLTKVASRLVKPRGEYVLTEEPSSFLAPLPLELLPGLADADLRRLHHVNIHRVDQATALSLQELSLFCDQRARSLYRTVRGIDTMPVLPATRNREKTTWHHLLAPDSNRDETVRSALTHLVQLAGSSLRRRNLGCRRVGISLLYTDGLAVARQAIAPQAVVDDDSGLQRLALAALYRAWHRRVRLRRLSLHVLQLQHPVQQLSLFAFNRDLLHAQERDRHLCRAMDTIRLRCGDGKILRGSQIGSVTK